MRSIGLDVHRDFCEVAINTDGDVASVPRVPTTPKDLLGFAKSLRPTDQVVLENTSNARAIAAIIEPHVGRVAIANPLAVKLIAHVRVKTDRIDARVLAQLLATGFLPEVYFGDEDTRAHRRRVSRRAALVKQRTAAKNEIHAVLMRTLTARPPVSDLFGVKGRTWLNRQFFAPDESETVAGCLRQIDMLDQEIAIMDKALATTALDSVSIRRLMTIPGLDMVTASALSVPIGDIGRFPTSRHLVSYPGLNPAVNQSGIAAARMGRISKAVPRLRAGRWSRRHGPRRSLPDGCMPSPGASALAGARTSPRSPSHASSRCSHGTCSPKIRTTRSRPSLVATKVSKLELLAGAEPARLPQPRCLKPRTRDRDPSRGPLQAHGRRLESDTACGKEKGRGAATGARIY